MRWEETGSVLIQIGDGETLADAKDRAVVEIMELIDVSQLYNVWSEPVLYVDAMRELWKGR